MEDLGGIRPAKSSSKINLPPEPEELETYHIKEEADEHSISQGGVQFPGMDFPVIRVIVKSEDNEDEPLSSQHHHIQREKRRSQADSLIKPLSDHDDTTSHSPETDDEHAKKYEAELSLTNERQRQLPNGRIFPEASSCVPQSRRSWLTPLGTRTTL
ncbi:uncharacterized protein LOC133472149 isoform X2 [Phyllopteryx taeniolatus]|uniref:uncharacterized protein LOC133472149 isoform X2 n=1 Tax=Phyllopteryx taeniolatus TaxID=161469 RepID=UPI002AD1D24D|nr:uncharacterized protein LOC133472149 isoform X2 [Phyllopteryx taeniolatus]XP_061618582.1 uncharacterized protein LOC133472149 isoform X2 [Phyllopteryx taeniolatus]